MRHTVRSKFPRIIRVRSLHRMDFHFRRSGVYAEGAEVMERELEEDEHDANEEIDDGEDEDLESAYGSHGKASPGERYSYICRSS